MSEDKGTTLDINARGSWLWNAAWSIQGAIIAPRFKDYMLTLISAEKMSDDFELLQANA